MDTHTYYSGKTVRGSVLRLRIHVSHHQCIHNHSQTHIQVRTCSYFMDYFQVQETNWKLNPLPCRHTGKHILKCKHGITHLWWVVLNSHSFIFNSGAVFLSSLASTWNTRQSISNAGNGRHSNQHLLWPTRDHQERMQHVLWWSTQGACHQVGTLRSDRLCPSA